LEKFDIFSLKEISTVFVDRASIGYAFLQFSLIYDFDGVTTKVEIFRGRIATIVFIRNSMNPAQTNPRADKREAC